MLDWFAAELGKLIAVGLLLPIIMILATPLVLIAAPFTEDGIRSGYRVAFGVWESIASSIQ
jgi:hypothetical protein